MGDGLQRARDADLAAAVAEALHEAWPHLLCDGLQDKVARVALNAAAVEPDERGAQSGAPRVFTWDWKAQPPLGEILTAVRDMPGPWFWFCPETGSDEYALILSGRELNADEAERILWERTEG